MSQTRRACFSLAAQIETPHRKITAILDPHQADIDPTVYLDKKVA
jgi:hypothetical protein